MSVDRLTFVVDRETDQVRRFEKTQVEDEVGYAKVGRELLDDLAFSDPGGSLEENGAPCPVGEAKHFVDAGSDRDPVRHALGLSFPVHGSNTPRCNNRCSPITGARQRVSRRKSLIQNRLLFSETNPRNGDGEPPCPGSKWSPILVSV
jgi:hypothetical protein